MVEGKVFCHRAVRIVQMLHGQVQTVPEVVLRTPKFREAVPDEDHTLGARYAGVISAERNFQGDAAAAVAAAGVGVNDDGRDASVFPVAKMEAGHPNEGCGPWDQARQGPWVRYA